MGEGRGGQHCCCCFMVADGLGEREREREKGLGLSCFCFMVAGAPTSWWSALPAVVDGGSSWLWWWVGGVGEIERERFGGESER
jgi:hypothetical protein